MTDVSPRGKFVWYDLMTSDPVAAESFYTAITGWGTQQWSGAEGMPPYTMWSAGAAAIGGLMQLPKELAARGVPPHWIAYIHTPDLEATVARAQAIGGKVLHPAMDIPTVGRFAVLADPQGAVFAAYTPANPVSGEELAPPVGHISWHELVTSDATAAFAFYSDLFGWEKTEAMDMGPMGVYQMFGRQGRSTGAMFNQGPVPGKSPMWLYYIRVPNADAAAELVKQHGGTILTGPMDVPGGGRIAQCLDPQSGMFAIHSIADAV